MFYDSFRCIGLDTLLARNPILLLGVIPFQTVRRDADKICGIMQVFGLCLDRSLGLERLTIELGKRIICKSPVISQAFTHLIPDAEPSW